MVIAYSLKEAYPKLTFPYISLCSSLEAMLSRPCMLELCFSWKQRKNDDANLLCDIHDGLVWKEFSSTLDDDDAFWLYLALNVDWFQPFKHTQYSVGAIYLSILNLPRALRFKEENAILIGIIPGPKEPPLNLNSFLQPLASELITLYEGYEIEVGSVSLKLHAVINLIACDIPATRKVLALPGHSATLGCSKCLKSFKVNHFGEKPDFSGFDISIWPKRDSSLHRELAYKYKELPNNSRQRAFEVEHGLRFCQLLDLPYFDIIRYHVIDPMHNLFEGSAKYFMKLLLENNLINMGIVKNVSKAFVTPVKIGRLPMKIDSNYSGFTADQWRNWTIIYSPIVLKDAITPELYDIWMNFVHACCLLCRRAIKKDMNEEAGLRLQAFCEGVQNYFGKQSCTMNMHLHLHLTSCVLDYGPLYGYWCFPFERYNGTIAAYSTNRKSFEKQLAKKFLKGQFIRTMSVPPGYDHLKSYVNDVFIDDCSTVISVSHLHRIETLQNYLSPSQQLEYALQEHEIYLMQLKHSTTSVLRLDEQTGLSTMYKSLYGQTALINTSSAYAETSKNMVYAGEKIKKGQIVTAKWPLGDNSERIGEVRNILKHTILFTNESREELALDHIALEIWWYKFYPQPNYFGSPCIVVENVYDPALSNHQYIPLQRIIARCAYAKLTITIPPYPEDEVIVVNPMPFNFSVL